MKNISTYINNEFQINELNIQDRDGNVVDIMTDDEDMKMFLILCKYADLFNSIEQQWHKVNTETPTSKAIKEETDKMFTIAYKTFTLYSQTSNFDYKNDALNSSIQYYSDDEIIGKKLSTIIRATIEWKDFYKSFKYFRNSSITTTNKDAQMVSLMKQFIIYSNDFVSDVQS